MVGVQDRLDDVLEQVGLDQRLGVEPVAVLRRDEHALDLDRPLVAVLVDLVAHRHLRLAVGPQVRQHVRLAHLREALRDPVRELDRQRHQLIGLVGGVAEHHPLVARADLVDRVPVAVLHLERLVHALRDVGRLLVERHHHTARLGVEAVLRARVPDLRDALADETRDVHVRARRDLAGDDDQACRDQRLTGDAALGIVGQDGVEHRVRDLVGDLVGMAFRHRLGAEVERACAHGSREYRSRRCRPIPTSDPAPSTPPRAR